MKKRLLSLFLVLAMLCTLSIGASAFTEERGQTGTDVEENILDTRATLHMSAIDASATTWCENKEECTLETNLYFYYYNAPNNITYVYNWAEDSASVRPHDVMNAMSAVQADSYHYVWGGIHGNWYCNLTETRP